LGYGDVFEQLEAERVRYVVVSGVAVTLHGYRRPTLDLDLAVDPKPHEARRATAALAALGFVPTIPLPLELLTVLTMLDRGGRSLDLFARLLVPFEELWADSALMSDGGGLVRVCSLEHLIRMKRLRNRPFDVLDVEGLLAAVRARGDTGTDG
jgi:hypothetical protein